MKILINTPSLKKLGGVSNHYIGLKDKWSFDIVYNTIGSRYNIPTILLLPFDLIKFYFKCLIFKPKLVLLNPSLQFNAIKRDALFLKISKFLNIPTYIFIHGWADDVEKAIDEKKFNLYKLYKKSDAFLVLANNFKLKLKAWGFKMPIYLTSTKVDDNLLTNFELGDKKYNNSILFLSRIEKYKGIYIVLDSFKETLKVRGDISLTIAGDGSELDNAINYVKNNNIKNVQFLGRISGIQLMDVFKAHSIYFFPTYGEGMPTSLLEAMAFAQVIITRPVGGINDFFENDKMGYLSKSLNYLDYVDILKKITASGFDMKKIGRYNYEYAKNNFLASQVAQQLEDIFKNVKNHN